MINHVRCTDAGFGCLVNLWRKAGGRPDGLVELLVSILYSVLVPPSPTLHFTAAFSVVCGSCLLPVESFRDTTSLLRTALLFLRQDSPTRASHELLRTCPHIRPATVFSWWPCRSHTSLVLLVLGAHLFFSLCFAPLFFSLCHLFVASVTWLGEASSVKPMTRVLPATLLRLGGCVASNLLLLGRCSAAWSSVYRQTKRLLLDCHLVEGAVIALADSPPPPQAPSPPEMRMSCL
jgi:hypothetical protein